MITVAKCFKWSTLKPRKEEASIQFFICKARAIPLPLFSQNDVLPMSYLQTPACRTSDDAKHFMKKQIANHAFVKENRHISSCSASSQFTFMRTLTLQRQTKTFNTGTGSWMSGYLEGNAWPPQGWWLQCFLAHCKPDLNPCHPHKEQNLSTQPVSPCYYGSARNCTCDASAKAPTEELSIWNHEK